MIHRVFNAHSDCLQNQRYTGTMKRVIKRNIMKKERQHLHALVYISIFLPFIQLSIYLFLYSSISDPPSQGSAHLQDILIDSCLHSDSRARGWSLSTVARYLFWKFQQLLDHIGHTFCSFCPTSCLPRFRPFLQETGSEWGVNEHTGWVYNMMTLCLCEMVCMCVRTCVLGDSSTSMMEMCILLMWAFRLPSFLYTQLQSIHGYTGTPAVWESETERERDIILNYTLFIMTKWKRTK